MRGTPIPTKQDTKIFSPVISICTATLVVNPGGGGIGIPPKSRIKKAPMIAKIIPMIDPVTPIRAPSLRIVQV
jgi:hypothetical protein